MSHNNLFEEEGEVSSFSLNKKFAAKFAKAKEQEELKRSMVLSDDDLSSSSEDEDSDGDLLTEEVEGKIYETLNRIKKRDPEIYKKDRIFFEQVDHQVSDKKQKPLTYKDQVRQVLSAEGAEAFQSNNINSGQHHEPTPRDAQEAARKAFLKAAEAEEGNDGLLVAKGNKLPTRKSGSNVVESFWEETVLDEDEAFLKDFLTNQKWKERVSLQQTTDGAGQLKRKPEKKKFNDSDDEAHLEAVDDFERTYNFRFEEEGSSQVVGHARGAVGESARLKDDKRKRKREETKSRKDDMKKQKEEELKRLKNAKKQEISRRMALIAEATGSKSGVSLPEQLLDTEFDPESYDKEMEQLLGDDYYEQDAENAEEEYGELEHQEEEEEEEVGEWILCDTCEKPIPPGKRFYECKTCPDFTICGSCQRRQEHPHRLQRSMVPEDMVPPSDWGVHQEEKKEAMEELFALDFEDVIADGIATRFKYRQVPSESFGLTEDDILTKPDSYLNRKVSLRKIAPYKN